MTQQSRNWTSISLHRSTAPMKCTTFDRQSKRKVNRWIVITPNFVNSQKHANSPMSTKRSKQPACRRLLFPSTRSLRASTPGRSGGMAGKGRRACNYVSGIWISASKISMQNADWRIGNDVISLYAKRTKQTPNATYKTTNLKFLELKLPTPKPSKRNRY